MIEILMKEVGMKKAVIVVLVVCMLTGAAFSSPVPLLWMFAKELGKAIILGIIIDIGKDIIGQKYSIGWMGCTLVDVPGGGGYTGKMQVCYRDKNGRPDCSALEECMP